MTRKKYELEIKPVKADKNGHKDWESVDSYRTKREAVAIAKKLSKKPEIHEAHITAWDDPCDDPVFDRYYQNGKLEFAMI